MYRKRAGTSGVRGQLYESKLISLLYFRASIDNTIEEFQLASNMDNIGAFDDICFKAKVKGHNEPVAVFIQAKHKEDEKRPLTYDLTVYLDSYLKIRKIFKTSNKDEFFKGTFEKTKCLFVIYTNATHNFNGDSLECGFSSHLQELIGTGGTVKQLYRHLHDVELLRKTVIQDQVTTLAKRIAEFISRSDTKSVNENYLQNIKSDKLVKCYHVILAQTVFDVSEIVPLQVESTVCKGKVVNKEFPPHRIATFRHDFFGINDEYLTLFKDILFIEILKERKIKSADVNTLISAFLAEPTDVTKLSNVIGTIVTYNNGQLEYLQEKASTKDFRPQLNQVQVPSSTVNEAVALAAREILLSRVFIVPVEFGNKDLTISDSKIERRINYLTSSIKDLLVKCDSSNLVTIDDTLEKGFLRINGGIAGAIGNIFVLDDNTKLMKITDHQETLGDLAKKLYERLSNEIPNLLEYKFCFKVNEFPKLSLGCSEYEENLASDFLKKLVIYSNQADEKGVEEQLKSEVEEYQCDQQNYLQVQTDAIFSKYHYDIQKWWMQPDKASYLTRESDLFQKAKQNIIKDPLLSVITTMYRNNIKHIDYKFTEDAVSSLNLQDHSNTVIITENSVLTVVKVMQQLKNTDHFVLDLKYIVKLPRRDRNLLLAELKDTNNGKVIILVCDTIEQDKHIFLGTIAKAVNNKKTVIVTNHVSIEILQKYFPEPLEHDEKNSLINLSEESQKSILESTRVMFQDEKVILADIVDDKSKKYVKGDVLHKIFCGKTIAVGTSVIIGNYDEIKHYLVDRNVKKNVLISLKTLNDIKDDVVIITAKPGMGKSTLLTQLSIKTKERNPEVWIVRINLLEYSEEFSKWKEEKTGIDLLDTLTFMCQVILRQKLGKKIKVAITLGKKDNMVFLKHCTADPLTELELNLFLHFYFKRKIIFLFDGFDEIFPHYTDVFIKCLKTVSNDPHKHRMWITSRCYNVIKNILEKEFGAESLYDLYDFLPDQCDEYFKKIWEFNLKLEELNHAQLENVNNLLEHVLSVENQKIFQTSPKELIYSIIKMAALYLSYEIKNSTIPLWNYNKNYHHDLLHSFKFRSCDCCRCCYCNISCTECRPQSYTNYYAIRLLHYASNPLILYLAAVDVVRNIKKDNTNFKTWYINVEAYTFYENFLESKIQRRYREKNGMNIYIPEIITAYEKELAGSILKHKKLAAYAIFNNYNQRLFSKTDLKEIKETIKVVENGEEKTGLIDAVVYGTPVFIHKTFSEHFAVEYICDCLKNENVSEETVTLCFEMMFKNFYLVEVRNVFDNKIKIDKTMASVLENNKDAILKWMRSCLQSWYNDLQSSFLEPPFMYTTSQNLDNLELFFDKIIDFGRRNTIITERENDMLTELIRERIQIKKRLKLTAFDPYHS